MSQGRGRSLTWRLTLLFAAVSSGVLLLLGLVVGQLVARHFEELDMALLESKLALARHVLADSRNEADLARLPARLDEAMVGHQGLALAVWDGAGQQRYATPGAAFPADLDGDEATPASGSAPPHRWQADDGRQFRSIAGRAATALPDGMAWRVAVSADLSHHEHFMHDFRAALWRIVGLAALASGLLGWLAARRGLAPLQAIGRGTADITARHLDRRLPVAALPTEVADLAATLNAMLERLEDSFRRLSEFSSDLAHELRTPVSNLLTQTQVTLARPRTAAEYQEVLASNAEEFERLSRSIADMLFLAKADNELIIPRQEPVDLAAEAASLLEFYEALAEEKEIRLAARGAATVWGDRLMLRRALGNLLSNAVRHTPAGGEITLTVALEGEGATGQTPPTAVLRVANTGPAIGAEHLPRLFDRFYRADPARQHLGEGAGLGLAITRSIARAHGGEVAVHCAGGWTTFEIRLPSGEIPPADPARP